MASGGLSGYDALSVLTPLTQCHNQPEHVRYRFLGTEDCFQYVLHAFDITVVFLPMQQQIFPCSVKTIDLEQLVLEPTRINNTLDLLLTNCPHLTPRIKVIPGLSDHCIPYCEFNITPTKKRQVPRLIPLYSKADWNSMRTELRALHGRLEQEKDNLSTEELWAQFRDTLTQAADTFIPQKTVKSKSSKPWITKDIRKLVKRRDRVYKAMKKLGTEELKHESRRLRALIQFKIRCSYWDYVDICPCWRPRHIIIKHNTKLQTFLDFHQTSTFD